ncbi:MAG TPA: endonuclease Q family protein [Candidatus Paceibacterota bacterium]|nr:endonuclease Q family protein [Candidatus Paceibacterota bacterium]HOV88752.1 endonuclease Q family protein [Candidatus Paceibacterota bacterium]
MKIVADFHIHSRFSRATAHDITVANLNQWMKKKGVTVLGTGDFTHPQWFRELKENLEPAEPGLYRLRNDLDEKNVSRFILTTELSCIYSQGGKTRRIHHVILAPSFEVVQKINVALSWQGNLNSDGRPILGLSSIELAKLLFSISPEIAIIPAHIWTPWFSLFGSMSGFDSLEECFGEWSSKIFAIETGLSSDPQMNWRLSPLDHLAIVSNSDSHSASKIAREANVFDTELSYPKIIEAIKSGIPQNYLHDSSKFLYTIEFYPEEGKYHFDGHRLCNVVLAPQESKKINNICPKCGRPLTIGVMHRVEDLADRDENYIAKDRPPYKKLVPLEEIIAEVFKTSTNSKKVAAEYERLIKIFGNELAILIDASILDIEKESTPELAEGIKRVRENRLNIAPGFDGEYGKVKIFADNEAIPQGNTLF